jgi:NDP-hexose-3-ketoreductase
MTSSRRNPEAEITGAVVRVGILGCSDIARRKFMPALACGERAKLTAISSRFPGKAAAFAGDSGCLCLTHEELIASREVDLVYLSLPNHLHEEWAIRVLEAGKHLICEKPLATSLAAAERMLALARRRKRLLYENQMFLFHPQHEVVRSLIASGRIGGVKALRCCFGFPLPPEGDFRLDPLQGGGAFQDLARYPLGAALYFLKGKLSRFRGHALWNGELNVAVQGGAVTDADEFFFFSIAFGQQYESYYEIVGETGKLRLERAFTTPPDLANRLLLTDSGGVTEIGLPAADHFRLMIEAVAAMIQEGADFEPCLDRVGKVARLAAELEAGCLKRGEEKRD